MRRLLAVAMFVPLLWLANHRPGLCALIAAIATADWIADDAIRIVARMKRRNAPSGTGVETRVG